MSDFTHFDEQGRAKMVNVGEKPVSQRTAEAAGRVLVNEETFRLIRSGGMKKGDVLAAAQIAGVAGAKRTWELIPMCHPILMDGIDLQLELDEKRCSVEIRASVSCDGRTGVEMEALTAVSTAALTVYDMCKAVQKDIVISDIRLLSKTGGVHGDFVRAEAEDVEGGCPESGGVVSENEHDGTAEAGCTENSGTVSGHCGEESCAGNTEVSPEKASELPKKYTAAVITVSDKGYQGKREDTSGPALVRILEEKGFSVIYTAIVPDEADLIRKELLDCADEKKAALVLTTGGTGFSPRDITPEVTLEVIERQTPGLPEAMRAESMKITSKGCLSRSVAGIRKRTLIINLPGSRKASTENIGAVIDPVMHGLDMLYSQGSADCGSERSGSL
ncbi:MAG: bifunctional molybdenum cofactor biosynthesis protein MoaC/MoaB [Lachnospiraceae bacterium]|nr:bifunctional molybdenum cofactor biosynthesis protein MoaC/MoaB [Lachnospiraceae bacterium]